MSAATLEARLLRLEDLEDIRQLTARYALHVDQGWNGKRVDMEAMPRIFTPDVRWHSPDLQLSTVGLDALMKSLAEETRQVEFAMHSYSDPVIELTDDHARASWLLWVASRLEGGPPGMVFMSQELGYARTLDGWRIRSVELAYGMHWRPDRSAG